jgi:hypothetical protein
MSRWKEHLEQHLIEGEERDQPLDQADLRDDGVEIDLLAQIQLLKIG